MYTLASLVFLTLQGGVVDIDSARSEDLHTDVQSTFELAQRDPATEKREPFKVFDNLHYVGIGWVAAWVIETSEGLILLDSLYGEYVPHLLDSLRKSGFDPKDIKYVFCTHAHFDHIGGAKIIQDLTGARVGMTAKDWEMLESDTAAGKVRYDAVKRDLVIDDGDAISLGDTTLTFYVTPGHTPGVLSMAFDVRDGENTHKAFMFGGVGLNFSGVARTEMYLDSVNRIKAMKGIEVSIPNHAAMGKVFAREAQLADRKPGDPHPFVAPHDFRVWLDELLVNGRKKLDKEREKAGTN